MIKMWGAPGCWLHPRGSPGRLSPQGMAAPGGGLSPPCPGDPLAHQQCSSDSWPAPASTFPPRSCQLSRAPSTGLCLQGHLSDPLLVPQAPRQWVGWDRPGRGSRGRSAINDGRECCCEAQEPGWLLEPSTHPPSTCPHALAAVSSGRGISPLESQSGSLRSPMCQHPEPEEQELRLQLPAQHPPSWGTSATRSHLEVPLVSPLPRSG